MKICKFGGSSLADAGQVRKVCDIVEADADRRIVVVSAPGKRNSGDTKVTDLLIACADKLLSGGDAEAELQAVIDRYREIQRDLDLPGSITDEIESELRKRLSGDTSDAGRFIDSVKAAGEDLCARLVAEELKKRGNKARYMDPGSAGMYLSDEFGNAQLLEESYDNLAAALEDDGETITVFPGFFGYTKSGDVATFPRGGSDITGSILAVAVKAEVYENFTDVDSVCAVDPDIAPEVTPIPEITYREMRELAYAGFGVLHDEAIVPAVHAGIPICIRNTNNPSAPGTKIVLEREPVHGSVAGIAYDEGFCTVFASKYLMNREVGFGRRFLQIFEDEGISYEHSPSGVDNISIILREKEFCADVEARVLQRIRDELEVDTVEVEHGLSLVMIVGEGMHYTVGIAARVTKAFSDAGVNIEMINQGSSEISMMFGVKADDAKKAVASIYNEFFNK